MSRPRIEVERGDCVKLPVGIFAVNVTPKALITARVVFRVGFPL